VHRHQEEICHFFEKPTTIMTFVSMGTILQLICQEDNYTIKGTNVRILKRLVSVEWSRTFNGTVLKSEKVIPLNIFNNRALTTPLKIPTVIS
jgi:hypothetical protein